MLGQADQVALARFVIGDHSSDTIGLAFDWLFRKAINYRAKMRVKPIIKRMNTGEKTLEWLYQEQLKVDERWSLRAPNGFTWWADKNAQKVELIGLTSIVRGMLHI